jgi:hypothetical protein
MARLAYSRVGPFLPSQNQGARRRLSDRRPCRRTAIPDPRAGDDQAIGPRQSQSSGRNDSPRNKPNLGAFEPEGAGALLGPFVV